MRQFLFFMIATLAAVAPVSAQTAGPVIELPTVAPPPVPGPVATAAKTPVDAGYVVGIGDVLDVTLVGQDDFKGRVTVQADGSIQLPFIGTITASDKTLLQLSTEIAGKLEAGGYYVDPAVQVTIAQISSRYVTVLGAVGTPGLIPIDREYRASEIIARVGGISPAGGEQFFLRHEDGGEVELSLETIARGGPDADPVVKPGDKIFVPDAATFYIYGQVNSPGTYALTSKMSLRMALARGGGLSALGSDRRITVVRNGEELKKFNLGDPLEPNDVVVVGERFF